MGASRLRCFGDSDLVAGQTSDTCDASDANMIAYRRAVDQLGGHFIGGVEWIDRRKNEEADALSRLGSKRQTVPPGIFLDVITRPSITPPKEIELVFPAEPDSILVSVVQTIADWTEPYIA